MVSKTIYVEAPSQKEKQSVAVEKDSEATAINSEDGEQVDEDNYQDHDKTPLTKPVKAAPTKSSAPQYKYYTIQKGDTLTKIANSKGVTVTQIKNLNKGLKENHLAVGQKIKIKEV